MATHEAGDGDLSNAIAERVRAATAAGGALRIVGGDSKAWYGRPVAGEPLSLAGHRGVLAYEPSELVITARAGTPLAEIEALLAQHRQQFAFEPLLLSADSTLGGAVAAGLAGPRRPFAGAVRDCLLGATVLDGRGHSLRFGGAVFKNVAGFDAFRLMAGALGCLGVLLDVTVRVAPIAREERTLAFDLDWEPSARLLNGLMRRPLPLTGAFHDGARLYLRLSGAQAAVRAACDDLGGERVGPDIWERVRRMQLPILDAPRLWRLSVPRTAPALPLAGEWLHDWAGAQRWLVTDAPVEAVRAAARAVGGHATLFRGARPDEAPFAPLAPPVLALHQRLKHAFDPAGVFNPGRMYPEL